MQGLGWQALRPNRRRPGWARSFGHSTCSIRIAATPAGKGYHRESWCLVVESEFNRGRHPARRRQFCQPGSHSRERHRASDLDGCEATISLKILKNECWAYKNTLGSQASRHRMPRHSRVQTCLEPEMADPLGCDPAVLVAISTLWGKRPPPIRSAHLHERHRTEQSLSFWILSGMWRLLRYINAHSSQRRREERGFLVQRSRRHGC